MRLFLALGLALCACRTAPPAPAPLVANATASDATRWKTIETLAAPTHEGRPSESLARALANRDVALLVQWMRESGTLRLPNRAHFDTVAAYELGEKALESATKDAWESVVAAGTLGLYLVQDGAYLVDAQTGLQLVRAASQKLKSLGEPANGLELPRSTDLVRIVAAEAMSLRDLLVSYDDPEVWRTIPSEDRALLEALRAFWPVALDGAKRDEPAAATLARMRAAATGIRSRREAIEAIVSEVANLAKALESIEHLAP